MSQWRVRRKRPADIRFPYTQSFFAVSIGVLLLLMISVALMDPKTLVIGMPGPLALSSIVIVVVVGVSVVCSEIERNRKR